MHLITATELRVYDKYALQKSMIRLFISREHQVSSWARIADAMGGIGEGHDTL